MPYVSESLANFERVGDNTESEHFVLVMYQQWSGSKVVNDEAKERNSDHDFRDGFR